MTAAAPLPAWLLLERLDTAAHAAARADTALQAAIRACADAGIHGPVIADHIALQRCIADPTRPGTDHPSRALRLVPPGTTGPTPARPDTPTTTGAR